MIWWLIIIWYLIGLINSVVFIKYRDGYLNVRDLIGCLTMGGLSGVIGLIMLIIKLIADWCDTHKEFFDREVF